MKLNGTDMRISSETHHAVTRVLSGGVVGLGLLWLWQFYVSSHAPFPLFAGGVAAVLFGLVALWPARDAAPVRDDTLQRRWMKKLSWVLGVMWAGGLVALFAIAATTTTALITFTGPDEYVAEVSRQPQPLRQEEIATACQPYLDALHGWGVTSIVGAHQKASALQDIFVAQSSSNPCLTPEQLFKNIQGLQQIAIAKADHYADAAAFYPFAQSYAVRFGQMAALVGITRQEWCLIRIRRQLGPSSVNRHEPEPVASERKAVCVHEDNTTPLDAPPAPATA